MDIYGTLDMNDEDIKKIQQIVSNCYDLGMPAPEWIPEKLDELGVTDDESDFAGFKAHDGTILINIQKTEFSNSHENGYIVDLSEIPNNVDKLVITNTY